MCRVAPLPGWTTDRQLLCCAFKFRGHSSVRLSIQDASTGEAKPFEIFVERFVNFKSQPETKMHGSWIWKTGSVDGLVQSPGMSGAYMIPIEKWHC